MKKLVLFLSVTLCLVPGIAFAAVPNSDNGSVNNQNSTTGSTTTANQGQSSAIRNCERIESRFQNRYENFGLTKDKHMSVYNNMSSRLDNFIVITQETDINTTTLKQHIATFKEMVTEFKTTASNAYNNMQETQNGICSSAEKDFRESLVQTRNRIAESHQQAAKIRAFYRDTLRPELLSIKNQLLDLQTTNNQETESEATDSNFSQ